MEAKEEYVLQHLKDKQDLMAMIAVRAVVAGLPYDQRIESRFMPSVGMDVIESRCETRNPRVDAVFSEVHAARNEACDVREGWTR